MGLREIKGWVETEKRLFAYQADKKRSTAQEQIYHKPCDQTDALNSAHIPKLISSGQTSGTNTPEIARPIRAGCHGQHGYDKNHPIDLISSGQTSGTDTPEVCTDTTSATSTDATSQPSLFPTSQMQTYGHLALLARISALLERGKVSKVAEEISRSTHSTYLKSRSLAIFSWRMFRDFYQSEDGDPLPTSSGGLSKWGTASSGYVLTLGTLEYPRTGSDCSLSDILEENPDPKYFLSKVSWERFERRGMGNVLEQSKVGINRDKRNGTGVPR